MSERDLVWLPKELAEKVKTMESDEMLENLIMKHIEDSKLSLTNELRNLEEEVLLFRGMMVKARNEFKKAKEEELNSFNEIYEDYENDILSVREKVGKITDVLKPLKNELNEVRNMMQEIAVYNFKELNEVIRTFSNLYGENKKILEFLIGNYRKDS